MLFLNPFKKDSCSRSSMGRKVLIITAVLRPEAWEKPDEELEADIKKRLSLEDIPWVERLEKIRVLSEEG